MRLRKSTSSGPGLRFATPSPLPARRLGPNHNGPKGQPYRDGRTSGAQGGGPVAGKAPRTDFHAFLPCSLQRSKKNPKARVNCAAPLPLLSAPLFLLAG